MNQTLQAGDKVVILQSESTHAGYWGQIGTVESIEDYIIKRAKVKLDDKANVIKNHSLYIRIEMLAKLSMDIVEADSMDFDETAEVGYEMLDYSTSDKALAVQLYCGLLLHDGLVQLGTDKKLRLPYLYSAICDVEKLTNLLKAIKD